MNLLEFRNLEKRFNKKEVLSDVSFNITAGEIFGLVGRSGCGKSTLFKILIGMVKADKGNIFFEGHDTHKKLNYLRENTGFATQDNMLFDELTVRENSYYFGELYGLKRKLIKQRFNELIDLMELEGFEETQIGDLSGGMAKRANILVSLIHGPKLLVLDEPTVGLDPLLRKILWEYIRRINKEGTTILVTSHLLEEIEENCDRVAILNRGKIVSIGSVSQYKEKFGKNKNLGEIFQEVLKYESN